MIGLASISLFGGGRLVVGKEGVEGGLGEVPKMDEYLGGSLGREL